MLPAASRTAAETFEAVNTLLGVPPAAPANGAVYPAAGLVIEARGAGGETWLVNAEPADVEPDGSFSTLTQAIRSPNGLAFGPDGSLFIAEWGGNRVRRVDPAGIITTVAGIVLIVFGLLAKNLVRSHIGREWMAMRDMDVAAEVIGIRPVYAKLTAFAVSSFIVGVAGALWGFVYLGSWEPAAFSIRMRGLPERTASTGRASSTCSTSCFLNSSNEPNFLLMASASAPVGAPPALGARMFQKNV